MDKMALCPCGSGNKYNTCCGFYLSGGKPAPTAEALMRSRYTAYKLHEQAYVLNTWHSTTRPSLADDSTTKLTWVGLEIKSTHAGGVNDIQGVVEFIADYEVNGEPGQMHEISRFVKEAENWFYLDGKFSEASQSSALSSKVGRNDPCICGSGKKYKKCCGNE